MKPTKKKIDSELKKLRRICETKIGIEARVAQAMEYAIRWATQETVSWEKPSQQAAFMSALIENESRNIKQW